MLKFHRSLALLLLLGIGSGAMAQSPAAGQLLISNPSLDDPNFGNTVLLLLRHETDGSLAIALNRPTWVVPAEAFPDIAALAGYSDELFFGGPIGVSQLLAVFESDEFTSTNALRVLDSVFVSPDLAVLDNIDFSAADAPRIRLFAGHAEWGPGQLALEIAAGNWRIAPAEAAMIFTPDAANLFQRLPRAGAAVIAAVR